MTTAIILIILFFAIMYLRKMYNEPITSHTKKEAPKSEPQKTTQEKIKQTYPVFIPFYKWKGFLNGLHPDNRKWVLSNGKRGVKPKKWNNGATK